MSSSLRVLPGACALAITLALGLAGCSASTSPRSQQTESDSQSTSAATQATTPTTPPTTEAAADAGLNAENFAAAVAEATDKLGSVSASFEMNIVAGGTAASATGAMRTGADGGPEMTMSMNIPSFGAVDVVVSAGIMYMNMGDMSNGKYVKMDINDPSLGISMPSDTDPASSMRDMADAILSVTKVGEPEQMDGVRAQAYDIVVDLSKVTGATRSGLDAAATAAESSGITMPSQATYRYWIGPDNLIRKMTSIFMGESTEATFSDWGEPVDIVVPGPDQVIDINEFTGQ